MLQCPVGAGTSTVAGAGRAFQGKPLACTSRSLAERRAIGFGKHASPCKARGPGFVTQSHSSSAVPALGTGQPQAPPPRPAPPPLERAGDLPDRLLRDYLSGWTSQFTEYDYYVPDEAVYGAVPDDIRGTLFLIGPGLTEVYGTSVRHPSDADGMVSSLAFGDGGQIFFRNRYVRTPSFVTEQTLGQRVSRGMHDRGAALVTGQEQQQQQQQRQAAHPGTGAQNKQHIYSSNNSNNGTANGSWWDLLLGSGVSSSNDSSNGSKTPSDGAANGSGSSGSSWGGVDSGWSASEEAEAERRVRQAAAAFGTSTGSAGAKPLRFDPLSLLGLPPLPPLSSFFNPLDIAFRAPANANVVFWAGRLLAFTEGGSLPYELNKLSLETVGPYDAGGAMADIGRLVGGYKIAPAPPPPPSPSTLNSTSQQQQRATAAPPSPQPHRLVVMGAAQSGVDALVRWVEVGEDGVPAGPATTYRLPGCWAGGVADFWVTDRHYVVVQAPLDFNPQRFATRAAIGAASFAECFDWDGGRPARIHLVARPPGAPAASTNNTSSSTGTNNTATATGGVAAGGAATASLRPGAGPSAATSRGGSDGRGGRSGSSGVPKAIVWPAKGPDAIVLDAPPLLPTSCVGCYSLAANPNVLVFDALCQQGLPGSTGGALDSIDPLGHRHQPKPELVRLTVDLTARTVSARILSQRTTTAATTATTFTTAGTAAHTTTATAAASAAAASIAPVGHGASFQGGYHHLYAAASTTDTSCGWAPSQVLLKLAVPPEHAVQTATPAVAVAAATAPSAGRLLRRRGVGSEVWTPGDRVFMGPPVFIPWRQSRGTAGTGAAASSAAAGGLTGAVAEAAATQGSGPDGKTTPPLPPLESEVAEAAGLAAATTAVRRQEDEQEGWLLVTIHDSAGMTAELCILDARDVTRGPVAVIALPHHLPHARGAHFTRAYCGPGLAAPAGWRPRMASAAASGAGGGVGVSGSGGSSGAVCEA